MSYNGLRQLAELRDWLGVTKLTSDAMGRVTETTDPEGRTIRYGWDSRGQRERLIYPDGSEARYAYDASGRLTEVESASGMVSYAYDAMGRMRERRMPEDIVTRYGVDPLGRLSELVHTRGNDVLEQYRYAYDPVGNVTEIEKNRAGIEADSGLFRYGYDAVGRLIAAEKDDKMKEYRYDSLGNRIAELQGERVTRHEYNAHNQLIRTQEPDVTREYHYDGRGNLTQALENGDVTARYIFDVTNRMATAVTERGRAEYAYDGFLRRVHKLEHLTGENIPDPTRELRYVLDITRPYDNLLATEGSSGQRFVWGNELLAAEGDKPFRYLRDHLGSPVRLVGGGADETLAYDEFGAPLHDGDNPHNPFGFTGYQTDEVSGLYYAQARYYDAGVGRFTAEDTARAKWNWYTYCSGNPIRFIDPLGLDEEALGYWGNFLQDAKDFATYFLDSNAARYNEMVNNPSLLSILDYFSLGTLSGNDARYQNMMNDTNWYTILNWASSGFMDLANGALNPDETFSFDHWMSSIGLGSIGYGGYKGVSSASFDPTMQVMPPRGANLTAKIPIEDDLAAWLGKNTRIITNKNGDKVFLSNDSSRRVRFDINNPSPHKNPHAHIEQLTNNRWDKSGPIYPNDVPPN